jgi:hypothetical protein
MLLANGGALTDWDRQVNSADDCRKCHIDLFDTSTGGAQQLLCVCVCHPIRWANLLAFVTIVGIFLKEKNWGEMKEWVRRYSSFHFLEYHH